MFLLKADLNSNIYDYQIDQITEGDDTIIETGIATGIEEVRSYLTPNDQHRYRDGRVMYDTDAIFNATGNDRNPLILQLTKTVAKWHIVELCNADVVYEQAKERYDRAIKTLNKLADGEITLNSLPKLDPDDPDSPAGRQPFYFGSREKFNYE